MQNMLNLSLIDMIIPDIKSNKNENAASDYETLLQKEEENGSNEYKNNITIYNEIYNCCDSVLKIDVALENNKIVIYELGDNLCDCICRRDVKYKVSNIPSGHYEVEIAGGEYRFEIDVK